jgi:hypothetical protein
MMFVLRIGGWKKPFQTVDALCRFVREYLDFDFGWVWVEVEQ